MAEGIKKSVPSSQWQLWFVILRTLHPCFVYPQAKAGSSCTTDPLQPAPLFNLALAKSRAKESFVMFV